MSNLVGAALRLNLLIASLLVAAGAQAQSPQLVVGPSLDAETAVPAQLYVRVGGSSQALPADSAVEVDGLPDTITLSTGRRVEPGLWSVPLSALDQLHVIAAPEAPAKLEFTVRLLGGPDRSVLSVRFVTLYVTPRRPTESAAARPPQTPPQPPAQTQVSQLVTSSVTEQRPTPTPPAEVKPAVPTESKRAEETAPTPAPAAEARPAAQSEEKRAEDKPTAAPTAEAKAPAPSEEKRATVAAVAPERAPPAPAAAPAKEVVTAAIPTARGELTPQVRTQAERFTRQGERTLATGNVAVARQYFLRAAELGLPLGALRMAETYEPGALAAYEIRGLVPDAAEAKRWHDRALAMGMTESEAKTQRLSSR